MNKNFINLETKEVVTSLVLKRRGLPVDNISVVNQAGWAEINYAYPEYDSETQKIEPTDITIDGFNATQNFQVISLPPEEIAEKAKQKEEAAGASEYVATQDTLKDIDLQTIRPLRAILTARENDQEPDPQDLEAIKSLETQAVSERAKLGQIVDYFRENGSGTEVDGTGAEVTQMMRAKAGIGI